MLESRQGQIIA